MAALFVERYRIPGDRFSPTSIVPVRRKKVDNSCVSKREAPIQSRFNGMDINRSNNSTAINNFNSNKFNVNSSSPPPTAPVTTTTNGAIEPPSSANCNNKFTEVNSSCKNDISHNKFGNTNGGVFGIGGRGGGGGGGGGGDSINANGTNICGTVNNLLIDSDESANSVINNVNSSVDDDDDPETIKPLLLNNKNLINIPCVVGDDKNKNFNKYSDYVNRMYSLKNDGDDKNYVKNDKLNAQNLSGNSTNKTIGDGGDEIRPLLSRDDGSGDCVTVVPVATLQQNNEKVIKRPKSIVKSPSSQSFATAFDKSGKGGVAGKQNRPRLSLQCGTAQQPAEGNTTDRHVQFLQHSIEDENEKGAGGRSSTISVEDPCHSPIGSIGTNSIHSSSTSSSSSSSSSDENSSIGQFSEARPPDGGWGWVVVFASFMVNLIADGVTFSFGVIYIEFLSYFGEGKAKTAWIGSLFMAMPLLSGPIASFLTDRYGCRKVTIAGSILASTGFVLSSVSTSMEMLFFTFGILSGFGLSLCYVAAVVIVAYYFDKKRSFATGLSVCGSGIGTFIFAPLTSKLLEEYGWRGTTLILAGIFLNMTVCGMLMRDLEWTTHRAKLRAKEKKNKKKLGISAESFSVSNSTNTGGTSGQNGDDEVFESSSSGRKNTSADKILELDDPRLFSSLVNLPTYIKNGEKVPLEVLELLSTHRNVREIIFQNYPGLLHSRSFSEPFAGGSHNGSVPNETLIQIRSPDAAINVNDPDNNDIPTSPLSIKRGEGLPQDDSNIPTEQEFISWLRRNSTHHHHTHHHHSGRPNSAYLKDLRMHRHSLTYRGAMLNINRYRLRASSCPDIYRNSMTTIAKEKTQWYQGIDEFKNLFLDILDFSYFADIRFLLFAISNFLLYTWYDVPYVYLADNATEMGYSETDASMLISTIGIVNMVGEIVLGWMGDKKWVSANAIYAISMAMCGAVIALVPLCKSYEALSIISGSFGLFIAANYSLTSIILVELITLEKFTNAYGLLLLVQGIANLVGPPLAGWIYDITGTYDLSFYLAGIFVAISGGMLLILPALGKYKKYKALKGQEANSNGDSKFKTKDDSPETPKTNGTAILSDCFGKEFLKDSIKVNHV